jgi:hypothetical protein
MLSQKLKRLSRVYGRVSVKCLVRDRYHWGVIMKTQKQRCAWLAVVATLAILLQLPINAGAQEQGPYPEQNQGGDQDPPGRVARLNSSQGAISFQPAGEGDWVTAVPNRPLVTGDNLWADENSRAEAHIGSTAIRLGSQTGITFLNIDDRTVQIRLAQGSLIIRVRHVDDEDSYEVDTPNLSFALLQPGEYRIDVSADGNQTVTTVWQGRGLVTGGGFTYTVVGHQSAIFTGSDQLNYDLGQLPQRDDLDQWAFERDQREDRSDSANYVSREMTGYEDLDENGDWSYVAGYGECWHPRAVAVGWAPYRYGHWVWVGPWGWTWVEDEPWGFAPFHYGRWASANGGWFWVPGPVVVRPVWAPALVAFVGGGGGFHFGGGVGVGWFPLGPGEVFVPGYRVSRGYVNNVNITNTRVNVVQVTNVYNTVVINKTVVNNITYVNQHVNNGVTVVSHDTFVNARPVGQNIVRVEPRELAAAPVSHIVAEEPMRQSVIGAGRPAAVRPPPTVIGRQVVAQRTPPAPPRSLDQRQAQVGGRLNQQSLVRPETGPVHPYQANEPARPQQQQNAAQRPGAQAIEAQRPETQRPETQTPEIQKPQAQAPEPQRPEVQKPESEPQKPAQPGGFRPFTTPGNNNNEAKPQPQGQTQAQPQRPVYEQQGTPENRNSNEGRPQQNESRPVPQQTHPLVRPSPPVQQRSPEQEQQQEKKFNNWQQQRPASPPAAKQQTARPPEQKPDKPKK